VAASPTFTDEQIEAAVNKIMVDVFEVDEGLLTREAQLVKDLGLDSLDGVDLVVALEKTFQCRIPEQEAREIRTLGDIRDRLRSRLAGAGAPP